MDNHLLKSDYIANHEELIKISQKVIKRVDFHKLRCYIINKTSRIAILERGENMKNNKIISNNLKRLREQRGIKQKFIAEQLGISANYYSQIENGHRPPQVEHLLKLRDLFNVSLDEIFFKDEIAKCDYKDIV